MLTMADSYFQTYNKRIFMLKRTFLNNSYFKMIEHIAFEEECLKNFSFPVNNNFELRQDYIWKGDVINKCILLMDDNSIKLIDLLDSIKYSHYHTSKELLLSVQAYFDKNYEAYQDEIEVDDFLMLLNFENFKIDVKKYASCQIICKDEDLKNRYKTELEIIKDMLMIVYYTEIYDIITGNIPIYIDNKLTYLCE